MYSKSKKLTDWKYRTQISPKVKKNTLTISQIQTNIHTIRLYWPSRILNVLIKSEKSGKVIFITKSIPLIKGFQLKLKRELTKYNNYSASKQIPTLTRIR